MYGDSALLFSYSHQMLAKIDHIISLAHTVTPTKRDCQSSTYITAVCKLVVIVIRAWRRGLVATPDNIVQYREALYSCYHRLTTILH